MKECPTGFSDFARPSSSASVCAGTFAFRGAKAFELRFRQVFAEGGRELAFEAAAHVRMGDKRPRGLAQGGVVERDIARDPVAHLAFGNAEVPGQRTLTAKGVYGLREDGELDVGGLRHLGRMGAIASGRKPGRRGQGSLTTGFVLVLPI